MGETPQPRLSYGAYQVQRELGRGGMGVVYEAVHEVLGRRAAIKVLLSDVSRDAELVERFKNEARAASAIEHPSIVKVYDVGHDDDTVYIVMELLPGESLATRLKTRGAMPIAAAINFARQCAKALEAAHQANIVHRDLKPDNVFLVPDPEVSGGERVKLLDFGVAKLVEPGQASVARTVTGAILGTPHYMSPEQCEGAREVDHRSDLYSLGCMLFQMVTGRLPFQSAGVGGLIGMHLHVAPPTVQSLRPDAPDALDALVARLLAKSPEDRLQSAGEVAYTLPNLNPSVRTSARTPEPAPPKVVSVFAPTVAELPESAKPPTRPVRRRWLLPVIGGLGALCVVGVVLASRGDSEGDQGAPSAPTSPVAVIVPDAVVAPVVVPDAPAAPEVAAPPPRAAAAPRLALRLPPPAAQRQVRPSPREPGDQESVNQRIMIDGWVKDMNMPSNWPVVATACTNLSGTELGLPLVNWERCVIAACKIYVDGGTLIGRAPQAKQLELRELCEETQRKAPRRKD